MAGQNAGVVRQALAVGVTERVKPLVVDDLTLRLLAWAALETARY